MKTLFLSVLAILANTSGHSLMPETIDLSVHPTIGSPKAKVEVVAFLEPKCPDSKRFYDESYPMLFDEYIKTNNVRYTVITTSFLPNSMPAAIALLCVYNQDQNPQRADLFFKYLEMIYENQMPERENWATVARLQEIANKASSDIDQNRLRMCIEKGNYKDQIEENTRLGNRIMGNLSTPTIYVDGVKVENADDTVDYPQLKYAIQQALKRKLG